LFESFIIWWGIRFCGEFISFQKKIICRKINKSIYKRYSHYTTIPQYYRYLLYQYTTAPLYLLYC
jgi:hypothetical protein